MSKVRVPGFSLSLDGFSAGPEQTLKNPLGLHGVELFKWFFPTRFFHSMTGQEGGVTDTDDVFASRPMDGFGAYIIGRNMFAASRGPWPDDGWRGWWGDNPPFHAPTFVLTRYERYPLVMQGGTVFRFVTGGIHQALDAARAAAGAKDVKICGGASTVRQYLEAGLVDTLHLAFSPTLLGHGEQPFAGFDLLEAGFSVTSHTSTENAIHLLLERAEQVPES